MSFCIEEWSSLENGRFDPASTFVYGHFLRPSSEQTQFFIFSDHIPARNVDGHPLLFYSL